MKTKPSYLHIYSSVAMETLSSNFPESYLLLFLFGTHLHSGKVHHLLASVFIFYLFVFGCAGSSLLWEFFFIVMASGGYPAFVVCRLLTVRFSCCKARAVGASASAVVAPRIYSTGSTVVTHGPWDLPGPGLKLMSPALAGGFFTTEPPGKLQSLSLYWLVTHTQSFLICCSTLPTTNPIPPETLWISLLGNARITLDSLYP